MSPDHGGALPNLQALRAWREEHYAGYDPATAPRRTRALFTIVRDEPVFFPIWLRYYSQFFAADDIYVLDHATSDGSLDLPGFHRVPVTNPAIDNEWMRNTVQAFQHDLTSRYDIVVHADSDEIIAPDPTFGDLGTYLDRVDEEFVTCRGFELLHRPDTEPDFDPTRRVLEQRHTWYANPLYNKSLITTEPVEWQIGIHRRVDGRRNLDPDLYLLHLHRMDREICRQRHLTRSASPSVDREVTSGIGYQNRIVDGEAFDTWFDTDTGVPGLALVPQSIPKRWRKVV